MDRLFCFGFSSLEMSENIGVEVKSAFCRHEFQRLDLIIQMLLKL